jgi:hypothetical protein
MSSSNGTARAAAGRREVSDAAGLNDAAAERCRGCGLIAPLVLEIITRSTRTRELDAPRHRRSRYCAACAIPVHEEHRAAAAFLHGSSRVVRYSLLVARNGGTST